MTSQGVTWTGLGGGVTLNHAIADSGDWGLESMPPDGRPMVLSVSPSSQCSDSAGGCGPGTQVQAAPMTYH